MGNADFAWMEQSIQLVYASDQTFLEAFRNSAQRQDQHLNLVHLEAQPDRLLLQSPTGSSQAQVLQRKTVLTTRFFGKFTTPDTGDDRKAYTKDKLSSLLNMLGAAGAKPLFIGYTGVAKLSAKHIEASQLKTAAVKTIGLTSLMSEQQPIFDFSARASRAEGEDVFSNVNLNWYQTRTLSIKADEEGGFPSKVILHEWDGVLADEGIEFKYDRNNKRGLFNGKRNWTNEQFLGLATSAVTSMTDTARVITKSLENFLSKKE